MVHKMGHRDLGEDRNGYMPSVLNVRVILEPIETKL